MILVLNGITSFCIAANIFIATAYNLSWATATLLFCFALFNLISNRK